MQVQSINNNNNNNMNFKALKGLKYVNSFNPDRRLDDAKIVKAVIDSPAVQEFAKKYDFMARFDRYIFQYYFTGDPLYSLEFLPVPVPVKQKQESSIFNFFKKIFRKNESQTVEQSSNVMPIPKETCQNLPIAFNIMVSSRDANEFINNINNLSVADIEERLLDKQLDKQQSAAKEEADKILHKQLLDKINQQFPN